MKPTLATRLALPAFSLALATLSPAQTVFDFRAASGLDLDGLAAGSSTVNGLTLSATVFPDGVFNQTTSAFGLNGASGTDDTDEFDAGEGFTFSFDQSVRLESLTVSSFGASASAATLTIQDGDTIASVSSTGLTSLGSYLVSAGTILRFESTGSSAFSLDSLRVSPVPEPAAFATLAALGAFACATLRRRRARR